MELDTNKDRFCFIIDHFCDSLVSFATYVISPTVSSTIMIKKKYIRTNAFDSYVDSVDEFNEIIRNVIILIREIIISLNQLFVMKDKHNLVDFIEKLRQFLLFLLIENVFENLNLFKDKLHSKYKRDTRIMNKITKVKGLIFRIFDISIDLTTIFIPSLVMVKKIVIIFEEKTDDALEVHEEKIEQNNNNLDMIIKQLLDIQLRSQIITSLGTNKVFDCLIDKESLILCRVIENLQTEYIELLHTTLYLKTEINIYKKTKKNLISSILYIMGK